MDLASRDLTMVPMDTASQDESKTGELVTTWAVLFSLGATFALARFYARFFKTKAHAWDDYFLVLALMTNLVTLVLVIIGASHGYGKHISQIAPSETVKALKAINFTVLTNGICMIFLKLSIGASLLRLQLGRGMTWIVWISIFISVCCNSMVLVGSIFACVPMAAIWDISLPHYTCIPKRYVVGSGYAQAGGNIVTDLFYSLSPLYYLRNVQVSRHNRYALRILFLVGLSATACSIAKLPELQQLANTVDPTYAGTDISMWASAEFAAGLIATSIPPLKIWFESGLRYICGSTSGSPNSSRKRAYYGTRSSIKPSRLTSRHSQHHILTEDSQVELSSLQARTMSHKTGTETSVVGVVGKDER
ncbi:hypothetical protein FKW77_002002 [Venturia effusa]|uniref:Rhodopsin domain-containing protein n=1 Tax=Venturia effusa TaxID=50376 RepID=A0A517LPM9_9PEZI|nr:hypothetical protein FKW77_002002 [Venturia effusa]